MPNAPKTFRPNGLSRKQVEQSWESRRNGNHGLYNQWTWRKPGGIRQQVLAKDPLCVQCDITFMRLTPSHVADHIIPHDGDRELFQDMDNLQGLCDSCHNRKTRVAMDHGKRTVVCGPPGSGKTTYVARHKSNNAVVWDADDIVKAMTGRGRGNWPEFMMSVIPSMLDGLSKAVQHVDVGELWIIVADKQRAKRVAMMIDAEVIDMEQRR